MPLLTLLSDSSSGGATTTNYALLLALTSDVPAVTPPTGTTNYALLLALTSESGATPPPTPTKRRGATYLSQAELRRLRKQIDTKEAKARTEQDRQLETITQAYDDIVHPEIRIARQANERARQIQDEIEQEEQEFLLFLLDNYDTIH